MHLICHDPLIQYRILIFALQYHILTFDCNTCDTPSVQYKEHQNAVQMIKNIMLLYYSLLLSHALQLCIHSHSHELSLEWIKQCWRVEVEEQTAVGRLVQLMQGGGSSARQSHDGPGCWACEREQVLLQMAQPSLPSFLKPLSSPPSSVLPLGPFQAEGV